MSFEALIGQQPAKTYVRSVLTSGRRGHAFLFKGPTGVGKRTAAYLFAQLILCQKPKGPDTFCGECRSCRWFAARKGAMIDHPDMISLIKPTSGDDKIVGDHEPMIRLETVQHVCEQLHRSPVSGNYRAVIIPEAQRLCRGQAEAANAFLKTLEEPPQSSLIVLTSSQPEGLLETIVSRVQAVTFKRLSTEEVRAGLKARAAQTSGKEWGEQEVELAARLCDGSLGRALELLDGDLKHWRALVLRELDRFTPRSCPQFGMTLWSTAEIEGKRLFEQEEAAEKANKQMEDRASSTDDDTEADGEAVKTEAGWKRYVFRRMLEICEVCFRDGMIQASLSNGATAPEPSSAELLLQPDQAALATSLAHKFGAPGCMKALSALREALLAVRLYVRGDVVGRALAGRLVEALRA
jgi:hypothetical protein